MRSLITFLAIATAGCSDGRTDRNPADTGADATTHRATTDVGVMERDRLIEQAGVTFDLAFFFKPADETTPEELHPLCPLIVVETPASDGADKLSLTPARIERGDSGHWIAYPSRPTVYYLDQTMRTGERTHRRLTFVWWQGGTPPRETGESRWRGFRMTLDAEGFPALWQVIDPTTPIDVWLVSNTLEASAARQFGSVLPGRSFAVERATDETPDSMVIRALADGPIPMGPFVYLSHPDARITTLICRCMPSQVRDFSESGYYELLPMEDLCEAVTPADSRQDLRELGLFEELCSAASAPFEDAAPPLRLPDDFR